MTQTPTKAEELRLADAIDPHDSESKVILTIDCAHAATMLRRLSAERDALQRKVQEMALQALADDTQHREVEAERDELKLAFAHAVRLVQDWKQSAYAMEAERDAMRLDYSRLLEKHNNLHANAARDRAERDALRADAERWRFALTQPYEFWKRIGFMGCAEDQNEAIDAARATGEQQ